MTNFESVKEVLKKNDLNYDCWPQVDDQVIGISINNGDWKHDHLNLDYTIRENFTDEQIDFIHTIVTEEDGSDCYSAEHYIFFKHKNKLELNNN